MLTEYLELTFWGFFLCYFWSGVRVFWCFEPHNREHNEPTQSSSIFAWPPHVQLSISSARQRFARFPRYLRYAAKFRIAQGNRQPPRRGTCARAVRKKLSTRHTASEEKKLGCGWKQPAEHAAPRWSPLPGFERVLEHAEKMK